MEFKELVNYCLSCSFGKMTPTAFKNILEAEDKIRTYVPIGEKLATAAYCKRMWELEIGNTEEQQVLSLVDGGIQATMGGYDKITLLYTWIKIGLIICSYFDVDYDFEEVNTAVLDSFYESGLIDFLKEKTNGDYQEYDKYIDWFSGIGYYPLLDVVKKTMMNLPSKEQLKEAMEQISQSKEAMENIKEIIKLVNVEENKKS